MTESKRKIEGDGAVWAEGFTRVLANGSVETYYGEQHGWCTTSNPDAQATAIHGLTTLLAEHRAEVETLTAEKAEALAHLGEVVSLGRQQARDAALEEAERKVESEARIIGAKGLLGVAASGYMASIRALKSQPARQYVDVEKVREALPYLRTVCGLSEQEVGEVLRRLDVDLDAEGEHSDTQMCGAQVMRSVEHTVREMTARGFRVADLDARPAVTESDVYARGGFIPPGEKR